MPVQKQSYNMNFAQGLDRKTDPFQVQAGKFLALENAVFQNGGGLQKRNGFADITTLPNAEGASLTTFNGNLIATGPTLYSFSPDTKQWLEKGSMPQVKVQNIAAARSSTNQTQCDAAVDDAGLTCLVYLDNGVAAYEVIDLPSGQSLTGKVNLEATATNPRVQKLGAYFIITYVATIAALPHLRYVAVPRTNPNSALAPVDLSTQVNTLNAAHDSVVANDMLYVAWDASDLGGAIRAVFLTSTLVIAANVAFPAYSATRLSLIADTTGSSPIIWAAWWTSGSQNGYAAAVDQNLLTVLAPTQIITTENVAHITGLARNNVLDFYYEVNNNYSYAAIKTDYLRKNSITITGTVGTVSTFMRSVGLASKPVAYNGTDYVLVTYGGSLQPTYFLATTSGNIVAKVAYSNGGGYITGQVLPNVTLQDSTIHVPILFKSLLVSVNKEVGSTNNSNVYTQTGVNIVSLEILQETLATSEIANSLHTVGGFVWQYDGNQPVEHGFHVFPEDLAASTASGGGSIAPQQYYYKFCYEWTDASGNIHRSAPSQPVGVYFSGGPSDHTNTIHVPTLRLTYKNDGNPVRLVGYRWSTAQQAFYQFTSISSPTLNDPSIDSITITDTLSDAQIIGNTLLYTTGGVVENIAAPACFESTLWKSRLFVVDAENRNQIWYSKNVLQGTPIEFSDLFTIYVAPTAGAQGSTGPITALSSMDDKLIIFKKDAIYYMTGNGPDATGANNDFSDPVFITSTVGCENHNSIVFMPQGIMFQSDKGIWLLGRDLSTRYIGAAVEAYNGTVVNSALNIPGTNQVRFVLESGPMLMYDYYYDQWGTFTGVPAVSSTLYQGLHTFVNSLGQVRQETPGAYLDGSVPVCLKFTTAWLKLTNLQGFQRAYFFYMLANYLSPHKLQFEIAYDYNSSPQQITVITPTNTNNAWGEDALWGSSSPWGGTGSIEQWRVFLNKQKCQSLQITMTEIYDASKGQPAGAGLAVSGINFVFGAKAGMPKVAGSQNAG